MTHRFATALAVIAFTSLGYLGCGGSSDDDDSTATALSSEEIIAAAKPATVALFGKVGDTPVGGTGFVYDAEAGLVVTNSHVVEGVNQLQAKVGDSLPTVPARVVGQSVCDDLAVVQLVQRPDELTALSFADSDEIESGSDVVALGYPASLQRAKQQTASSTEGTVSNGAVIGNAIGVDLPKYPSLIQHTAAINPGNSGGPLLDQSGNVVGINTLTTAPLGNQGQYYSISSDQAADILPTLEAGNSPGFVGWSVIPLELVSPKELAADYSAQYNTEESFALKAAKIDLRNRSGLYVLDVPEGSAAKKADIYVGDLITAINGTPVRSIPQLCKVMQSQSPGAKLEIDSTALSSGENTDVYGDEFTSTLKLPKEAAPAPELSTTTTSSTTTTGTEGE